MFKNQRKCMNLKVFLICLRNQPKCMKLKLSLHLILLMKQCVKIMDFILILTVLTIVKVSEGALSCKKEITTSSVAKLCPIFNNSCSALTTKSTPSTSCVVMFSLKNICVLYFNCSIAVATTVVTTTNSSATSSSSTTTSPSTSPVSSAISSYKSLKTHVVIILACVFVSLAILCISLFLYCVKH